MKILFFHFSPPEPVEARKFTQILFVVAVSFGCYIHGTTVSYPSVFVPGLTATNATKRKNDSSEGGNGSSSSSSWTEGLLPETLPYYVYQEDIALIGSLKVIFTGCPISLCTHKRGCISAIRGPN
jgi:hypothetical protein